MLNGIWQSVNTSCGMLVDPMASDALESVV